jgi:putative aldouronate transport system substrate-binding protein
MVKRTLGSALVVLLALLAAAAAFASGSADTGKSASALTTDGAPIREYPIKTEKPLTLSFWMPIEASAAKFISSFKDNTALVQMEKDTGVTIKWLHPAVGQEQEQFNLLMASGDLPDLLGAATMYKGGEFKGMLDGVFQDLTPMLAKYAPDYVELIKKDNEFFREVSDPDGRVCAFYAYKPQGDPPYRRFILRDDVLADLKLEIPKTIADWEKVFEAMKNAGMAPYALISNGYEEQFIGPFGIYAAPTTFYKDAAGKVRFGQVEPEFKQYLQLMSDWYKKGYISKDFTSLNGTQIRTLFDTRKIGTMVDAIVANFNRGMTLKIPVTSAPYPRLKPGDKLHYEFTDIWPRMPQRTTVAVVTKACKTPEIALRFLNYGYTQKGFDLLNWGVEGVNWTMQNGKKVYNDLMLNNAKFGTEEASYIYKTHFFPKLTGLDTVVHANLLKSPASLASRQKWATDPDMDTLHKLPPYQLPADDLSRFSKLMSEIDTYANEMVLKFIVGNEPIANFDKFVATIKSMGIDDAIRMQQAAYDKYMAKKSRF